MMAPSQLPPWLQNFLDPAPRKKGLQELLRQLGVHIPEPGKYDMPPGPRPSASIQHMQDIDQQIGNNEASVGAIIQGLDNDEKRRRFLIDMERYHARQHQRKPWAGKV